MVSFIESIQRILLKRSYQSRSHLNAEIRNFDKVKSVCVISEIDESQVSAFQNIEKAYQEQKKSIDMFLYLNAKELPDSLVASNFNVFSKSDGNKVGLLKKEAVKPLSEKTYDLAIYYNPQQLICVEQLALTVNSRLLVGLPSESGLKPDVMFHTKSPGLSHFVDTANNYLKNINQKL